MCSRSSFGLHVGSAEDIEVCSFWILQNKFESADVLTIFNTKCFLTILATILVHNKYRELHSL